MNHVTLPKSTAMIKNAPVRMRSMQAPETIEAAVQEKRRNAAQNTPLMRDQNWTSPSLKSSGWVLIPPMWAPMSSLQGSDHGADTKPPVLNGTFVKEK